MFRHSCLLVALFLAGACAGPEPPRDDYFPTRPGYQWEYDISRTTPLLLEPVLQKSIVLNLKAGNPRWRPALSQALRQRRQAFFHQVRHRRVARWHR